MKIERIEIKNYKSIHDGVNLINPNRFTVFVGPNAAGKSNFFEALEFFNTAQWSSIYPAISRYGGKEEILNKKFLKEPPFFSITFSNELNCYLKFNDENLFGAESRGFIQFDDDSDSYRAYLSDENYVQFFDRFSRIFPGKNDKDKMQFNDDQKLSFAGGNLEKVLRRLLNDDQTKSEIEEWLNVFIPGYDHVDINWDGIAGKGELRLYEQSLMTPLSRSFISDGTYNLLCILAAVYQSKEPQFLLIEEPENGINPKVQRELIRFFREHCEKNGHYIWLNTHSQTMVSELKEEEIIIVEKIKGETNCKQIKKGEAFGLKMDEAWLTNTLGGGVPW